jgi:hypothetical protein
MKYRILILRPSDVCFGVIDSMATAFGMALESSGCEVIYFDIKTQGADAVAQFVQQTFDAVVDFYSGLLGVQVGENQYFWNFVNAPIYQFDFDYPLYISHTMNVPLRNYHVLCMDEQYCEVIEKTMPNVDKTYHFPPTGISCRELIPWSDREIDVSFVGTSIDYRDNLNKLKNSSGEFRVLGETFFSNMQEDSSVGQKEALEKTLEQLRISVSQNEFYQMMDSLGGLIMSASHYYRANVIQTLLAHDITVDVYGDTWRSMPFAKHPKLNIHSELRGTSYEEVMANSKFSLNILYPNKQSFSERIGYTLLNGAVCVCDESSYMKQLFQDKEEMLFYRLDRLEQLPDMIKRYLVCPEQAQMISAAGRKKALEKHTWAVRAEQFLQILCGVDT